MAKICINYSDIMTAEKKGERKILLAPYRNVFIKCIFKVKLHYTCLKNNDHFVTTEYYSNEVSTF